MLRKVSVPLAVFATVVLVGCGGMTKGKPAAEKAIAHFHNLFNEGKLDDIWNEASPDFRAASQKQKYDEFMGAVHRKLGKVTSTSNSGWNVRTFNLKTSVSMNQRTVFEQGQG